VVVDAGLDVVVDAVLDVVVDVVLATGALCDEPIMY
jgi:hypothetical protein